MLRRVINANLRLGSPDGAVALAAFIANTKNPNKMRVEALAALSNWTEPPPRDRVLGDWQPLPGRDRETFRRSLQTTLGMILNNTTGSLRAEAMKVASKYAIEADGDTFFEWATDDSQPQETRIEALRFLGASQHEKRDLAIEAALHDDNPRLRAEARHLLAGIDSDRAIESLSRALEEGTIHEKQRALGTLAAMKHERADSLIGLWLDELLVEEVDPQLELDVLEAARGRAQPLLKQKLVKYEASLSRSDPFAAHRVTMSGGDPERGRHIFFNKVETQCQRCHVVGGKGGGDVGPDLSDVGRRDRNYILESIVDPNRTMAEGFDFLTVVTKGGILHTGRVLSETATELRLRVPFRGEVRIPIDTIVQRQRGTSSMPSNLVGFLKQRELRDLVEFLARQKRQKR